jgi:hypothetical protein
MAKFNNDTLKTMHNMMVAEGKSYKQVYEWYKNTVGNCSIHYMALQLRNYKKSISAVVPGNVAVESNSIDTKVLDKTPA